MPEFLERRHAPFRCTPGDQRRGDSADGGADNPVDPHILCRDRGECAPVVGAERVTAAQYQRDCAEALQLSGTPRPVAPGLSRSEHQKSPQPGLAEGFVSWPALVWFPGQRHQARLSSCRGMHCSSQDKANPSRPAVARRQCCGHLDSLRTYEHIGASHRLWAIRCTKARTSPAARPETAPHPRPGSRPRFEDHAVAGSVRR